MSRPEGSILTAPVRDHAGSLPSGQLPAYLYDLAALRAHAGSVRAALPAGVELYYAAKANPEPEILAALTPFVDGYEVSSGGELAHVAKALPDAALAFGGPGKTPDELRAALELGVRRFHVESEHELRMLADLSSRTARPSGAAERAAESAAERAAEQAGDRVGVLLRVNLAVPPGMLAAGSLTMGGRPAPFGLDPSRADAAVRLLTGGDCPRLELLGVHAHLASGLAAPQLLAVAASVVTWSAELFARHRIALREVNVGGGMDVDYGDPAARFDWPAYGAGLGRLAADHPGLLLRIEPGRALTAYCGFYATEVLDVKRSHGAEFAVVRGGTHHLRTPAAKGHDQPCSVLPVEEWPHPGRGRPPVRNRSRSPASCAPPRTSSPAGSPRRESGPATAWSSPWPARTRGTSRTTTS